MKGWKNGLKNDKLPNISIRQIEESVNEKNNA
jgi:hypothetical protein